MLTVRIPKSIESRIQRLARRTGRTKSFFVREAVLQHIEDLEDVYLAERALQRVRDGKDRPIPLEVVLKRHGIED